jgi:hypothetical protein
LRNKKEPPEIVGPLIGFLSVPRSSDQPRLTGAFFSATVESKLGPQTWRVVLDGRSLVVTTTLELVPGQTLRLKLTSQQDSRLIFQTLPEKENPGEAPRGSPLMAAFLSRGLALADEKLALWTRWLKQAPRSSDREGWAASLEAREAAPSDSLASGLQPWLGWQAALEAGQATPSPAEDYWDLWNTRKTAAGDPWLVQHLRWEFEGKEDSGLLQAHFNPQRQAIDQWNLSACPAGVAFRLEAACEPRKLDLTWRFFDSSDLSFWENLVSKWEPALSSPDLLVRLRVSGPPSETLLSLGGVDVQA